MQRISRYEVPNHSIWYHDLHRTEIYAIKEKPKFPSIILLCTIAKEMLDLLLFFCFNFLINQHQKKNFFVLQVELLLFFILRKIRKILSFLNFFLALHTIYYGSGFLAFG